MTSFDRTYEGLKRFSSTLTPGRERSFDRTYEGLKQYLHHHATYRPRVLTVPMRV